MIHLGLHLVGKPIPIQPQIPHVGETWVVQRFIPRYSQIVTKFPFDMWEYRTAKILPGDKYYDGDEHPYSPSNESKPCYWGSPDKPHGECFDSRLLPIWGKLDKPQRKLLGEKRAIFACHPVYEPDYYGMERMTFRILRHPFSKLSLKDLGRCFRFEENREEYVTIFTQTPEKLKYRSDLQLITSEWIPTIEWF